MSFRKPPATIEEHIAFIYEWLRRLPPVSVIQTTIQEEGDDGDDLCPCPINIRTCTPGGPDEYEYAPDLF